MRMNRRYRVTTFHIPHPTFDSSPRRTRLIGITLKIAMSGPIPLGLYHYCAPTCPDAYARSQLQPISRLLCTHQHTHMHTNARTQSENSKLTCGRESFPAWTPSHLCPLVECSHYVYIYTHTQFVTIKARYQTSQCDALSGDKTRIALGPLLDDTCIYVDRVGPFKHRWFIWWD